MYSPSASLSIKLCCGLGRRSGSGRRLGSRQLELFGAIHIFYESDWGLVARSVSCFDNPRIASVSTLVSLCHFAEKFTQERGLLRFRVVGNGRRHNNNDIPE